MVPRQALFVFPAFYRVGQRFVLIVFEEVFDIPVVFELSAYVGIIAQRGVCVYRVSVSAFRMLFDPILKRNGESESLSQMGLEKHPFVLRTQKVLAQFLIQRRFGIVLRNLFRRLGYRAVGKVSFDPLGQFGFGTRRRNPFRSAELYQLFLEPVTGGKLLRFDVF